VPDLQTFVDDRSESQAAVPVSGNQLSDIPPIASHSAVSKQSPE